MDRGGENRNFGIAGYDQPLFSRGFNHRPDGTGAEKLEPWAGDLGSLLRDKVNIPRVELGGIACGSHLSQSDDNLMIHFVVHQTHDMFELFDTVDG